MVGVEVNMVLRDSREALALHEQVFGVSVLK